VPSEKEGLTICGKRGLLPVLTTAGAANTYSENLLVQASQVSLERIVIIRADSGGPLGTAITAEKASISLRGAIVSGHVRLGRLDLDQSVCVGSMHASDGIAARDGVFFGHVNCNASCSLRNVLVCGAAGGGVTLGADSDLRHCTITGPLRLAGLAGTVVDSIVQSIDTPNSSHTIEYCNVFGDTPYLNQASPGKECRKSPPLFGDAKGFDFRLQSGSPCRKAGSDGGDMGFAYTPELQTLLKLVADLRGRTRGKM
jgi:hypothetical protein